MGAIKTSKYKENKQSSTKETNTLDNKHRMIVKQFAQQRTEKQNIIEEIKNITNQINEMDSNKNVTKLQFTLDDIKKRAELLDRKDKLEIQSKQFDYDEMDYYDIAGDLITDYYDIRDNKEYEIKESKNILEFLCEKKNNIKDNNINKVNLLEKYCQRIDGIRINQDDGSKRIKYCVECNIEKILDMSESAYICPLCGDSEIIILDEDRQIKDYSPYRRLNHFREWLNQFQAKQSPNIPEQVFIDIVKELNKNRINLILSLLSCGWHYSIETYVDLIKNTLSDNGILILDIRHNTGQLEYAMEHFDLIHTIVNTAESKHTGGTIGDRYVFKKKI